MKTRYHVTYKDGETATFPSRLVALAAIAKKANKIRVACFQANDRSMTEVWLSNNDKASGDAAYATIMPQQVLEVV